MFDRIAPTYDFLNHFLSLNTDKRWRKKAMGLFQADHLTKVLDIATGTGDLALACLKEAKHQNVPSTVFGIDFSFNMIGQIFKNGKNTSKFKNYSGAFSLMQGNAEALPFPDKTFTGAMIAFGIRNVENIPNALKEAFRVLRPGGRFIILEFSKPNNSFIRRLYNFYFHKILPVIGNLMSRDKGAYNYLPQSVSFFPSREEFQNQLLAAGFQKISIQDLSLGISTIYLADRLA
jgi:demethylmenaquinone methyltransferase/2-methoxy-6-polyprenyl-1,4-benzoquinol methylase